MTRQNAENAGQADHLMQDTANTMKNAGQAMVSMQASIVDITRASEETSKIIKTIDEISFQTNLLALNAAVEAARAGLALMTWERDTFGWADGYDEQAGDRSVGAYAAGKAYESAGIGPGELSLIELHDASAPSEIIAYEYLGICDKGMGGSLIEDGSTRLGGRLPVNVSGGLLRKGHPIGASGARILTTLLNVLRIHDARYGVATLCIGGGEGSAVVVERL